MSLKYKTIAVDFDGTIAYEAYPEIGGFKPHAERVLKKINEHGGKIIIWTCRTGDQAELVKTMLLNAGIQFEEFNDNLKDGRDMFPDNSRKVFADVYIDDRANFIKEISWLWVEENLFEGNLVGVYEIINTKTGKRYVGSSANVFGRFKEHKRLLNNGHHWNKELLAEYREDKESFAFNLLEECSSENLAESETKWIERFSSSNPAAGYNKNKAGHAISSYEWSEERRRERSIETTGEGNGFYGKKHTEETKLKLSNARKGTNHYNAKLSLEDCKAIKELLLIGVPATKIAKQLGCSDRPVGKIKRGEHHFSGALGGGYSDWTQTGSDTG